MTIKPGLKKFGMKEYWRSLHEKFSTIKQKLAGHQDSWLKYYYERKLSAPKFILIAAAITIIVIAGMPFSGQKTRAYFGKEFQIYAGQEAEIDGMQLRLERPIIPSCESGADCKSIGSVITIISQGKILESQLFKGVKKDFFIVDKTIGVSLTDAGGGSAKFIVTMQG